MTLKPPNAQLRHFGIYVRDMKRMIDFYTRVLGMVKTDAGDYYRGGQIVFLSRDRDEHHQIVLAEGRTDAMGTGLINQVSFRVASLEDLRTYHALLKAEAVSIDRVTNHGNAWSIYCFDPEQNRIELYAGSPWYVSQPFGQPLDLTASVETIMAETRALVAQDPSCAPAEAWSERMGAKLRGDESNSDGTPA